MKITCASCWQRARENVPKCNLFYTTAESSASRHRSVVVLVIACLMHRSSTHVHDVCVVAASCLSWSVVHMPDSALRVHRLIITCVWSLFTAASAPQSHKSPFCDCTMCVSGHTFYFKHTVRMQFLLCTHPLVRMVCLCMPEDCALLCGAFFICASALRRFVSLMEDSVPQENIPFGRYMRLVLVSELNLHRYSLQPVLYRPI
jgi:hypothetical protein